MKKPTNRPFLRLLAVSACAAFTLLPARAGEPGPAAFFFRDGDRAIILGDSITEQKMYSTLVESFVLSRFPEWKISFRNTGWSGDTMGLRTRKGLDPGFERDLKPLQPTAVTIDFGMNDARAGDAGYAQYVSSAATLADKLSALGARVAFITSSPEERYVEGQPAGSAYNPMLRKYSDGLKQTAKEKGLLFVDQLAPMIEVIESGRKAGVLATKEGGPRLVPDGVHPNWAGHLVMAASILKGLNAPPLVSRVEIDAKSGKIHSEKAVVSDVKTGETVSFTRLDDAMPWPMPADEVRPAAAIPGFSAFDDLSAYSLKATSLEAEKYKVSVDGKELGTFTKSQLAGGVNLAEPALKCLPEIRQLLDAIVAKNEIFFNRWRRVQAVDLPDWLPADAVEHARAAKLKDLDAQLAVAEDKVNSLRKPKPHQWVIAPALSD
ncbi:MAG: SGNH/GDSL hydrolase family protein [Verrucomicrobiae bacterium]